PLRPRRRGRGPADLRGARARAGPARHAGDQPPRRHAPRPPPRGAGRAARADRQRRGVPRRGARPAGDRGRMSVSDAALARLAEAIDAPDLAGTRYELRGRLGRGGMGTVWRALDRELGCEVALKVMNPVEPEPGAVARLRMEAKVLARLEHPGLVPVHD